ncbi:class I SAM-dependent methyltransferase [Candidatus Bipolaricaulota bacterium]|nr:class I SAM-dependent methyltransferase [Candidatus Bipolaricaulota bacterium]
MRTKAWDWDRLSEGDRAYWDAPAGAVVKFAYRLKREAKRKVYDLGCGLGRHLLFLAQMGFDVCGSDLSERAVEEARKRLFTLSLRGHVKLGDMVKIQEPDDTYDAVIAYNVVYHAYPEGMRTTVKEIHRILKGGGLLLVTFQAKSAPSFQRGKCAGPSTTVKRGGPEDGIFHTYLSREEVLLLLSNFSIDELYYVEHEYAGLTQKGCHFLVIAEKTRS